jgi:hypothetical protein
MGEVAAEPVRDARRQCGDDDLVEPASLKRLLHGGEGIIVADDPFDVTARGPQKQLIEIPGVVAVTLGDSRGLVQPDSEWGFGLYYRDAIRAEDVRALGFESTVVEPGDWGRLANGGGQLTVEGQRVDLLYRDLEVVQHWIDEGEAGSYEVERWRATWLAWPPTCWPESSPWRRCWRGS